MNDEAINKIKKLLSFKNGGTPAEIENAVYLAKKIADKNNIDIESIDLNEKKEPITHSPGDGLSRLQTENKYCAIIVHNFFNVNTLTESFLCMKDYSYKHRVVFVGTQTDIEIAKYVYNFLVKHFRREWNTKRGRLRNRKAFMKGLYVGLFIKLKASEAPEQYGLILANRALERRNYIDDNFKNVKKKTIEPGRNSEAAFSKGYDCGLKTDIRKGLTTTPQTKILNQ